MGYIHPKYKDNERHSAAVHVILVCACSDNQAARANQGIVLTLVCSEVLTSCLGYSLTFFFEHPLKHFKEEFVYMYIKDFVINRL